MHELQCNNMWWFSQHSKGTFNIFCSSQNIYNTMLYHKVKLYRDSFMKAKHRLMHLCLI